MTSDAGHLNLRELRTEHGWTQQEVAERLARLIWLRRKEHVGVNADMVAKWERGAKGISRTYREHLCILFRVTADQAGFTEGSAPRRPRDEHRLVALLDSSVSMLDHLGDKGAILGPQVLAALKDQVSRRRSILAVLEQAGGPSARARIVVDVEHLDQLADRYDALYESAEPAALLTAVAAHVRTTTNALHSGGTRDRRRLLANHARVAILAGRLSADDLGDTMTARGYYSVAIDSAREADDDDLIAYAHGHAAELCAAENQTAAALHHLAQARTGQLGSAMVAWLDAIEAMICADAGQDEDAGEALTRAQKNDCADAPGWFHEQNAVFIAAGLVHAQAGLVDEARDTIDQALTILPASARRARVLCLAAQAVTALNTASVDEACALAAQAAELLGATPYARGTARLRAIRNAATPGATPFALQALDDQLRTLAAVA